MTTFRLGLCSLALGVSISVAAPAWSQEKVGVVTTVVGPVTVARASLPPTPLRFKDDILLRDRVTTGDNAITRILLGGKVIVTARERSTLTITEIPGLSTIDLSSGRIAVAVDKTRMKPGERVEIRTPNAIAGVRGTVLIVEVDRDSSTVTVLRGLVDVVRIDRRTGRAFGPTTPVAAQQAVIVRNGVLPSRPRAVPPAQAQQLSKEFTPPVRVVAASAVMPVETEVARAQAMLDALLPPRQAALDASRQMPGAAVASTPLVTTVGATTISGAASASLTTTGTLTTTAPTLLTTTAPTLLTTTTPTLLTTTTPNLLTTTTTNLLTTTTNTLTTTTDTLTSTTNTLLSPLR